jgi:hypothetical protein
MRKFFGPMGSVSRVTIERKVRKSNMLGDPPVRVVDVYIPAGHDGQGLPPLVNLVGFTSSGLSQTNWAGLHENLPERLDRLIGEQRMPPVVVAFPDCFTRLGGNQYGFDGCLGGLPAARGRGVFGKSSGGYGAITHALRHCDIWAAAACHSGDMGFELCYLPDMPAALRAFAGAENSIEKWWQQLEAAKKHPEGSGRVINALAMAASYDPDPTQFLASGSPSPSTPASLSRNAGARGFVRRLNELGRAHRYEEFPDNHSGSIIGWMRACLFSPSRYPFGL